MEQYYDRKEISNGDLTKMKLESMGLQDKIDMDKARNFYILFITLINQPDKVDHFKRCALGSYFYAQEDFDKAVSMAAAFRKNSFCAGLLRIGRRNRLITDPDRIMTYNGIEFRMPARCSWNIWIDTASPWGINIRPTSAKNLKQFKDQVRDRDWDRGAAWNMDVARTDREVIVGVSKENYEVFTLPVQRGDSTYTAGRNKYEELAFVYWDRYLNN